MKICGSCISVDTGTLHFANALNVPVVGIFYVWGAHMWASDTNLYPAKILDATQENPVTPSDIIRAYKELMGVCV
jgi:ADP-heptose:LPS heptosyltransferase